MIQELKNTITLSSLPEHETFAFIDGKGQNQQEGVWFLSGLVSSIQAQTKTDLVKVCQSIEELVVKHHVILLLDYELGYWCEPAVAKSTTIFKRVPFTALAFNQAVWIETQLFNAQLDEVIRAMPEHKRRAGIVDVHHGLKYVDYRAQVERILAYIRQGDCYQINFTWPLIFQCYGSPLALYHALRKKQPVQHGAFICHKEGSVLSLSPELFLERQGSRFIARPMKGTAPRGASVEEDHTLALALKTSEKNQAENLMIVDLIRNDLGKLARPGTVKVESLFEIETYPTVMQMVSQIAAEIKTASLYEILQALFPCGSVTGAPKIRAMQIIHELEQKPRHLYTGCVGHIYPGGDFSFNVAIRTLELERSHENNRSLTSGRLGIGSGIVADSNPQQEFEECLAKARFLTELPVDFELIETLRLEPGDQAYPYLSLHLERLSRSARYFGFRCQEERVLQALNKAAQECRGRYAHQYENGAHSVPYAASLYRVRLTLSKQGEIQVKCVPLEKMRKIVHVRIAQERINSSDLFLQHKTTVRILYDQKFEEIKNSPEIFDVLFFNEHDELTEGTRSNIFLMQDKTWLTPPVSCGLLNGVMRQVVLARTDIKVKEKVLYRDDLLNAEEIYLTNAVRGVMYCQLVS